MARPQDRVVRPVAMALALIVGLVVGACGLPTPTQTMTPAPSVVSTPTAGAPSLLPASSPPTPAATLGLGPTVDGVPVSLNGQPVLRAQVLRDAIAAGTDATPFLVGGWLHEGDPRPISCPASGPDFALDVCTNGFNLYDQQVGWTRTQIAAGDPGTIPRQLLGAADRPVVLFIHTHDGRCTAEDERLFTCSLRPMLTGVAWLGAVATVRPSPTPVGTPPPTSISRTQAIALARRHAYARPGVALTVACAAAAPYSQVFTNQVPPPDPDRWVWAVAFEGGTFRSWLVALDYETGSFIAASGASSAQKCVGGP